MARHRIEVIVYALGVAFFGLLYYQLKGAMSGPVFLGVAIAYLLALRLIGYLVAKRLGKATSSGQPGGDA